MEEVEEKEEEKEQKMNKNNNCKNCFSRNTQKNPPDSLVCTSIYATPLNQASHQTE